MSGSDVRLAGVLNEPPLDPLSWSGTARHFFGALDRAGLLAGTVDASMSKTVDLAFRAVNVRLPVTSWRDAYHLDVRRFRAFTAIAGRRLARSGLNAEGVLQIGAWYCLPDVVRVPCYSYHDGNLALQLRSGLSGLDPASRHVARALDWERETYRKLSGIFVMSTWLGESFVSDFGVPRAKVHVVGAGINFDSLPLEQPRGSCPPRYLMVGRDFERKGGTVLLEAFRRVRSEIPGAELTLIGPSLPSLPDGVRCLGFLSKKDPEGLRLIEAAYRDAGIYVLPSLYEPFGISLLEAMAYSLPCIATNHCAMPEIVEHGVTGLVVAPGQADALANAMLEIARAPERAALMGAAGRRRLLARYTWDAVARRIGDVVGAESGHR